MIGQSPPRTGGLIYDRYQPSLSVRREAGRCQIGPKDTLLPGSKNTKVVIAVEAGTPRWLTRTPSLVMTAREAVFDQVLRVQRCTADTS